MAIGDCQPISQQESYHRPALLFYAPVVFCVSEAKVSFRLQKLYMTRNLRLNGIDRFVKSSPHLHLEEYDSCEVPSGCGGVVLRWTNINSPIALDLVIRQNGKLQGWMNGRAMAEREPGRCDPFNQRFGARFRYIQPGDRPHCFVATPFPVQSRFHGDETQHARDGGLLSISQVYRRKRSCVPSSLSSRCGGWSA